MHIDSDTLMGILFAWGWGGLFVFLLFAFYDIPKVWKLWLMIILCGPIITFFATVAAIFRFGKKFLFEK